MQPPTEVHLVFAWSDEDDASEGTWQLAGTAAAFFLHHAIASLDASIQQKSPGVRFLVELCGDLPVRTGEQCGRRSV